MVEEVDYDGLVPMMDAIGSRTLLRLPSYPRELKSPELNIGIMNECEGLGEYYNKRTGKGGQAGGGQGVSECKEVGRREELGTRKDPQDERDDEDWERVRIRDRARDRDKCGLQTGWCCGPWAL